MIFSKSFGYAIRGILYIAVMQSEKRYVQVDDIAQSLGVPRHFMGKILKRMVKENVLASAKGPAGGFTTNDLTLDLSLFYLVNITDGLDTFQNCTLRLQECNDDNPCPLHFQMTAIKHHLKMLLLGTRVGDLLKEDKTDFVKSISTVLTHPVLSKISPPQ